MTAVSLEIVNLHGGYEGEKNALRAIDLRVAASERMAVLGPNGAGKSTLIQAILGFLAIRTGSVTVSGIPLQPGNLRSIRRKTGVVFQNPDTQLFMPTALDDVAFALLASGLSESEAHSRSMAQLRDLGIESIAGRPPHLLSLGEKKRVALAGALVLQPDLLLLDEPGSGLDPGGSAMLERLLDGRQEAMLICTHDLDLARRLCTHTAILDQGELVACGPCDEILNDRRLLETHRLLA